MIHPLRTQLFPVRTKRPHSRHRRLQADHRVRKRLAGPARNHLSRDAPGRVEGEGDVFLPGVKWQFIVSQRVCGLTLRQTGFFDRENGLRIGGKIFDAKFPLRRGPRGKKFAGDFAIHKVWLADVDHGLV